MTAIFKHADGGHYRVLHQGENVRLKTPGNGEWRQSVIYREVDLLDGGGHLDKRPDEFLSTTAERWQHRFERVQ